LSVSNVSLLVENYIPPPTVTRSAGREIPFGSSIVFVKEDGDWKVIHQHISIGVPNAQAVGQDLTVS
jgi:hypothetical protein